MTSRLPTCVSACRHAMHKVWAYSRVGLEGILLFPPRPPNSHCHGTNWLMPLGRRHGTYRWEIPGEAFDASARKTHTVQRGSLATDYLQEEEREHARRSKGGKGFRFHAAGVCYLFAAKGHMALDFPFLEAFEKHARRSLEQSSPNASSKRSFVFSSPPPRVSQLYPISLRRS